jgi:LysR family glycine cleavage system transcriptional activator
MTYRLPPLNALRAFEAAARHLSFKDASEELSVTPTAISHQIRGLEEYLGFYLFRRLTRALELTREGPGDAAEGARGPGVLCAAIESTRQHEAGGRLLVTSPPAFANRWLIRHLPAFTAAHPEIQLHMAASLDTIDARDVSGVSGLEGIDVRDDETEVFIRFRPRSVRRLPRRSSVRAGLCRGVQSAAAVGDATLNEPGDLRRHNLLHDESIMELLDRPTWAEWLQVAGVSGIDPDAGTHFSDPGLVLSAAVDGVGVAMASKPLVEAEVAAGRLVVPFDIVIRRTQAYYLVVPEAVADRPIVSAFRRWLRSEAVKVAEE